MPKGHFKKKLNIGNFVVWAGCLAAFISLFLNFATASIDIGIDQSASESVRLIDADDEIFFIIVIVAVPVINLFKLNIVTILGIILMLAGSVTALILNLRAKKAAGS